MEQRIIIPLNQVGLAEITLDGSKYASLWEMIRNLAGLGVHIPDGFIITSDAYWQFLEQSQLTSFIKEQLDHIDFNQLESFRRIGSRIRHAVSNTRFPHELSLQIIAAYEKLSQTYKQAGTEVAIRSSAAVEDLADANFAELQETYLNIRGPAALIDAVRNCYASLFTDRAISYGQTFEYDVFTVGLSVCVYKTVE